MGQPPHRIHPVEPHQPPPCPRDPLPRARSRTSGNLPDSGRTVDRDLYAAPAGTCRRLHRRADVSGAAWGRSVWCKGSRGAGNPPSQGRCFMNANDARIAGVYTAAAGGVTEDNSPNAGPPRAGTFDLIVQLEAGNVLGQSGANYTLTITA